MVRGLFRFRIGGGSKMPRSLPNTLRGAVGEPVEGLWRVAEVAAFLGVHPKDVYAWALRGDLPCVRLGRRVRFDPGDVRRWVAARKGR